MKRHFQTRSISFFSALALGTCCSNAFASDFNIPFINAAGLGNLYSGWAASAEDATTALTNPAGLIKLPGQQLTSSALGVMGSAQFSGTATNPLFPTPPETGVASTKLRGFIPTVYYASRPYRNIVFGFGASAPFALGSNYATDSIVRYTATRSQILVMDIGPSLGWKANDQWSLGLGLDFDRMTFTLNQMYGLPLSSPDSQGQNHLAGWGYGWHGGVLYQPRASTRIGLSYNSMVMFHTSGDSEVFSFTNTTRTTAQRANAPMPARTQLSVTQDFNQRLTGMATLFYTNWSSLQKLTLQQTMTPLGVMSVTIPFNYHNTFDYSVGLKYLANDKVILRTGAEILTTPSNNRNRSVVNPVGCGLVLGLGMRYQQNAKFVYDVSYAHGFFQNTQINFATPLAQLDGHESMNTNILAGELTWNIA